MNSPKITTTIILFISIVFSVNAQEKLMIGGSGWTQLAIIDKSSGNIEWSYHLPEKSECNHVRFTQSGDILFSYKKGARLVNMAKETIWDYKANEGEEVQTAKQLPNGNYFLAVCAQPSRFITLNKKGELINEQNYDLEIQKNHAQFRQVTPTSNHTLIIPVFGKSKVIEIDKDNNLLREIKIKGNLFGVKILSNKKWLVSCGDAHQFVIVNPKSGKIIKRYTSEDVKGCALNFVAEIHYLHHKHYLLANWHGHSKDKTQPKIVEINKNGNVDWTLPQNDAIKNVSSIDFLR